MREAHQQLSVSSPSLDTKASGDPLQPNTHTQHKGEQETWLGAGKRKSNGCFHRRNKTTTHESAQEGEPAHFACIHARDAQGKGQQHVAALAEQDAGQPQGWHRLETSPKPKELLCMLTTFPAFFFFLNFFLQPLGWRWGEENSLTADAVTSMAMHHPIWLCCPWASPIGPSAEQHGGSKPLCYVQHHQLPCGSAPVKQVFHPANPAQVPILLQHEPGARRKTGIGLCSLITLHLSSVCFGLRKEYASQIGTSWPSSEPPEILHRDGERPHTH